MDSSSIFPSASQMSGDEDEMEDGGQEDSAEDQPPSSSSVTRNNNKVTSQEEYDPSCPLDSSEEEDEGETSACNLQFEKTVPVVGRGEEGRLSSASSSSVSPEKGTAIATTSTGTGPITLASTTAITTATANTAGAGSTMPAPDFFLQPFASVAPSLELPDSTKGSITNSSSIISFNINNVSLPKDPEIDLSSIPMPSDEYRRPTIQFSIPTRHRLMSISSLIKRQKGVMKKQDKGGGSAMCYNSEVSKAFHKSDGGDGGGAGGDQSEDGQEDRPKVSLVEEIFGSDDEDKDIVKEDEGDGSQEDGGDSQGSVENHLSGGPSLGDIMTVAASVRTTTTTAGDAPGCEDASSRWKTIAEDSSEESLPSSDGARLAAVLSNETVLEGGSNATSVQVPAVIDEEDENSMDEIRISIKPPSELLEAQNNDNSSDVEALTEITTTASPSAIEGEEHDHSRGKENSHIILECVSDEEEPDFEVTFVGIKSRTTNVRVKQPQAGPPPRLPHRRNKDSTPPPRKRSISPINGFEEGEIVELSERKKQKKAKKRKSKKRKRSKDSRISSKASERSPIDSADKNKSFSENSDSKEVSWRKPKMAKARNYRYVRRN
jgi:hypothetical protein